MIRRFFAGLLPFEAEFRSTENSTPIEPSNMKSGAPSPEKTIRRRSGAKFILSNSAPFYSGLAMVSFLVSASQGVSIDLTDATPTVTGAETLHIDGISTMGSNYWVDFQWNERTNKFDVSGYGVEYVTPPEGFALVETGTFTMGSPLDELGRYDDEVQHEVTLTRDLYVQETEVTQGQWSSLMGWNPSHFEGRNAMTSPASSGSVSLMGLPQVSCTRVKSAAASATRIAAWGRPTYA